MKNKVFNIPASQSFVDVLAQRLLIDYRDTPLRLAEVLILLPNRRAVKALGDAFVRAQGEQPTLLPQMFPLGEVDEDNLLAGGVEAAAAYLNLPPAIERTERLLLFTKIIMAKPTDFGLEKMSLNQACYLAQELATLFDSVNNQELSFEGLQNLVPAEFAAHWQETLRFLEIITRYWPEILAERKLADPGERRRNLLKAQSDIWKHHPPEGRVIAAGTTAAFPAMKELIKTIVDLENGEIILAGLDKNLDDESWDVIDESHPQYELKELLDYLKISRFEIRDIAEAENPGREKLVSEIMRPAKITDRWLALNANPFSPQAIGGLNVINCKDIREEALAIALIMRESLEVPMQTAALVTPDRQLARRVASELQRWNIKVDDSAGVPLAQTPVGSFLRQIAAVCMKDFPRVAFLSLLKHPLCGGGSDYGTIRRQTRNLEKKVWRGGKEDDKLEVFVNGIKEQMRAFYELCQEPRADFQKLLELHVRTAEKLATTDKLSGEQILWRGEAGEAAAQFIADLYQKADVLGIIDVKEYPGLLEAMIADVTVRPRFGTHPRLKILGPIEARLTRFDVTIIGEVNEGVWPLLPGSDPWMSRPMKTQFGLPLPERSVGVTAQDFAQLLGAPDVYMTRAERVQGTPMVKSRWLLRLETVLKAAGFPGESLNDDVYKLIVRHLDQPVKSIRVLPPAPTPPVEKRPRQLSASSVEMLMRDPYAIYARYILKLKPLEEIDQDLTMADYGTIIHAILEEFNNRHARHFPENAAEELLALGENYFKQHQIALETRAFWWPNFVKTVKWLVEKEKGYRQGIRQVYNEQEGQMTLEAPAGKFLITAKADRIDETYDGSVNIVDYKTGRARSNSDVQNGTAPQLPIEGLIAQSGGFANIDARKVAKLIYWQLAKKETVIATDMENLLKRTKDNLQELISLFDFESTPYHSQPNPKRVPEYSDYEHLARVKEWSVQGGDDD